VETHQENNLHLADWLSD